MGGGFCRSHRYSSMGATGSFDCAPVPHPRDGRFAQDDGDAYAFQQSEISDLKSSNLRSLAPTRRPAGVADTSFHG